jgi:hypothetical protein
MKRILTSVLFLAGSAIASAQPAPPVPSALALATIPGLSSEQQQSVRRIFLQRRDAEEALRDKQHAEFDALRVKGRSEHERIDESTDASLRKLLGEEGYRKFAEWQLAQRPGPHGPGMLPRHGPGNAPRGTAGDMSRPATGPSEALGEHQHEGADDSK